MSDSATVNVFFLGKGGVGKSTSAALFAIQLANRSHNVLLASFDPAHNQSQIFEQSLNEKPTRVLPNLSVLEVDVDGWMKRYVRESQQKIRQQYRYLGAFNFEQHLNVLRYAPAMEEYAMLLAFKHLRRRYQRKTYLIIDMPPTALALKFFNLPELSLIWLRKLRELRAMIMDKKRIDTKIRFGKKQIEHDRVTQQIEQQIAGYEQTARLFKNTDRTALFLVLNNDSLSMAESDLIRRRMESLHISLAGVVLNKYLNGEDIRRMKAKFPNQPISVIPFLGGQPLGIENLQRVLLNKQTKLLL